MNVLFMGQHYTIDEQKYLMKICKNGVSTAHYNFQNNIINSLEVNGCAVNKLTTLPVGNYPLKCRKLIFKARKKNNWTSIGFINLPWLKHFMRALVAKKYINDWLYYEKDDPNKVILIYDCYIPFVKAAIRSKINACKIILIVPDLPGKYCIEYQQYNWITKLYKNKELRSIKKLAPQIGGGVVLTKSMTEILHFNAQMVLEAICKESEGCQYSFSDTKKILYAGELSTNVGIQQMICAFGLIPVQERIELIICGTGEMADYVKKKAEEVNNIQYKGFVGYDDMSKLFNEIDVCINPRMDDFEYTRYSFPSKNIEYLRTGKPVVAYKLSGIPEEYDEFFFYPDDNSPEALKEAILKALEVTGVEDRIRRQLEFVNSKKSVAAQGKHLLSFLGDLSKYE